MQQFDDTQFRKFSSYIYDKFGIYINESKKEILRSKLNKLIQRNKIDSYRQYYDALMKSGNEHLLAEFANEITVNQTSFFRENNHFEFIRNSMDYWMASNGRILKNREIRVWCAACSTGEEAYTSSMVLKECMPPGVRIRVLATDINKKVLAAAQKGVYPSSVKYDVKPYYLNKYFIKSNQGYEVTGEIKALVTFRFFNLMDNFPFKGLFDIIFCRNVMIYFDTKVRQTLLDKLYNVMTQGGLLFIGHSESITAQTKKFKYVQPTIYMKY